MVCSDFTLDRESRRRLTFELDCEYSLLSSGSIGLVDCPSCRALYIEGDWFNARFMALFGYLFSSAGLVLQLYFYLRLFELAGCLIIIMLLLFL